MRTLDPRQELAVIVRTLADDGYDDKLAGHISIRDRDDGTLLVNPYGLFWPEVTARDILRVDADGTVIEGIHEPNPTVVFHLELHRARPDVGCAIHSHPPYGNIWAAAGALPPVLDQTGAQGGGKAVVYAEYEGVVMDRPTAARLAAAYDDADLAILSGHGTLVTAATPSLALVRAQAFEWRCRKAWEVESIGRPLSPLDPKLADEIAFYGPAYSEGFLAACARRLEAADPEVLSVDG